MRSMISGGTQLVSPRVSRSPRQPSRTALRLVTGNPSIRIRVFSGPMPRISIWRLFPRWPLVELPVRLTPGMVRIISAISRAGGCFFISSAVMVDTPGACNVCSAAVTIMVSSWRVSEGLLSITGSWVASAATAPAEMREAVKPSSIIMANESRDNFFIFLFLECRRGCHCRRAGKKVITLPATFSPCRRASFRTALHQSESRCGREDARAPCRAETPYCKCK